MAKKQQISVLFFVVMMALLFCFSFAQGAERDVVGKTYYTTANIWYENPEKIYSTNYHRGTILPVGTKVTIKKVSDKEIRFVDENNLPFKIIFLKKHSSRNMNIWDFFNQYFSELNPMRKGGPFEKFSKEEKENIQIGEITEGMSKAAVLMSYGYPPSHRTPSLKSNIWTYWINRFVKRTVYFKDDKVYKIDKGV
jgi:hypothetical protein